MLKRFWPIILLVIIVIFFAVYTMVNTEEETEESDELTVLEVEFIVPDTAEVDETVELKAIVTYGDEQVTDADEVEFEIWEIGNEDDSYRLEGINNEDGTYTAETTFEHDGVFEMYAHTTARDLHTMPKKSITVGTGESAHQEEEDHEHESEEHDHYHAEGFDLHFVEPENLSTDNEAELVVHLQMDGNPLENADVRYELWSDELGDQHIWVDAEENTPGEYQADHLFTDAGTYHVMIHVENDEGLHEHEEYELIVE